MKASILKASVLAVIAAASPFAAATAIDLKYDIQSRDGIYNSTYAKAYNYSKDGVDLTVTGASNSGSSINTDEWIGRWNGLGVEKTDSPEHAINNANGDFDMLVFTFSEAVQMDRVSVGWIGNDSDISVVALSSAMPSTLSDWASLGVLGASQHSDVGSSGRGVNAADIASRFWMVGAYNPLFGNKGWSLGNEAFKLRSINFTVVPPTEVTSPGTLGTLLLGTLALIISRRRSAKA